MVDPEEKRLRIGRLFIEVFEEAAQRVGKVDFLVQGTLYPDVIESRGGGGPAARIKSHHNVGGLPERMRLQLVEPLRELFKDEVREVGRRLAAPDEMLMRHPFPGPGLAVRILGEVTEERLAIVRASDRIFIDELRASEQYDQVWQAFTVLLPVRSVGVMGDERTYAMTMVLRAVTSVDGMTADWARLPAEVLERAANRIVNEVRGVEPRRLRHDEQAPGDDRVGMRSAVQAPGPRGRGARIRDAVGCLLAILPFVGERRGRRDGRGRPSGRFHPVRFPRRFQRGRAARRFDPRRAPRFPGR